MKKEEKKNGVTIVSAEISGRTLTLETGRIAGQANGSVMVTYGESVILATAVMSSRAIEGLDFFPLTVDYEENYYAAGKVRGSRFVKRKGRPTDEAVLTGRVVDRSIRPFFPDGMRREVQVILTALSFDKENDPEFLALVGASAALAISDIPFETTLAGVKVGLIENKLVLNPKLSENGKNNLDLTAVFTKEGKIAMLEAGAKEIPEDKVKEGIKLAQTESNKIIELIEDFQKKVGKEKQTVELHTLPEKVYEVANEKARAEVKKLIEDYKSKPEYEKSLSSLKKIILPNLVGAYFASVPKEGSKISEKEIEKNFSEAIDKMVKEEIRKFFVEEGKRIDKRKIDQIRPLQIETNILPRTHGSAIFARGWTQGLTTATLGSPGSAMTLEGMEYEEIESKKHYMHFYSFPPFSTGECKPMRGPGRREIGHGALGEKALEPVTPDRDVFPYTIVMQTEIMSSDGSTSMASVCGSTLALMDAGVPIKKPVAGIAMGLMYDPKKEKYTVLTDLCALEDFSGFMDFKSAGTKDGITAIQMDIKLKGLPSSVIEDALDKSYKARLEILDAMSKVIAKPNDNLSPYAPRVVCLTIPIDKIRDVIGPGGKMINSIIEKTGVIIDIEQDGTVNVTSENEKGLNEALALIKGLTKQVEAGEVYTGKVVKILEFGAFVELTPNQDGMVHVSQIAKERVNNIRDYLKEGDEVKVKVKEIDDKGRVNLTMLFDE